MRIGAVAVDLEFVKTGGAVLARSAAFVPFVARSPLALSVTTGWTPSNPTAALRDRAADEAVQTTFGAPPLSSSTLTSSGADSGSRSGSVFGPAPCCHFPTSPSVLSLTVEEVMRVADVLPCGHTLLPHLEQRLVSGEALARIKAKHASEANDVWDAYRLLQRDLREQSRASTSADAGLVDPHDDQDEHEKPLSSQTPQAAKAPGTSHALSPQEVALRRQFQMRAAIPRYYEVLDPYGIPNISRLPLADCRALYTEELTSSAFLRASQSLSVLRAYGRGKGKQKALAFLFRYYPEFAQDILRTSFSNCDHWITFLRDCRDVAQRELERVQASHESRLSPLHTPFTAEHKQAGPAGTAFHFTESRSLADLSLELNRTWAAYLYGRGGHHKGRTTPAYSDDASSSACKFFAYGNSDASVLHATLQSSCTAFQTRHFSPRAAAAGAVSNVSGKERFQRRTATSAAEVSRAPSSAVRAVHLSPVPQDVLVSPFQAKLLDVTQHTLFKASGFATSSKKIPSLANALEKLVTKDPMAARVYEVQAPHDPLWDAQALACVCVGCGVVR